MRSFVRSAYVAGRRFGQFALSIVLLAGSSLWFVRSAIETGGLGNWASIAVGQTVGAIAAVLVGYGWSIAGPVRIAAAPTLESRRDEYFDALLVRSVLLTGASLVVGLCAVLMPATEPTLVFLGALPVMISALSASFYYVGIASPARLFVAETIPRVAASALAAALLSLGSVDLLGGLLLQLLGAVVAVCSSSFYILGLYGIGPRFRRVRIADVRSLLRRQRGGLTASLLVSTVSNAPILIVSAVAPAALGPFSVVDKLSKQVLAGSSPVTSVLQGWVPRDGPRSVKRRARAALLMAWIAGVAAAASMFLVSPVLVHWLAAGSIPPSVATSALMGAFVGLFLTQNAVSFACLAAQKNLAQANLSMAVCSPLGLFLVAVLSPFWGTNGALVGVCAGMVLACIWQSVAVMRFSADPDTQK